MDNRLSDFLGKLTDRQLRRLHWKVWDRIGSGGLYGWDRPTLRLVFPHLNAVDLAIRADIRRRAAALKEATCPTN